VNRKRKAELSPIKNDRAKRSALGNLTNAAVKASDSDENLKKGGVASTSTASSSLTIAKTLNENVVKLLQPISSRTRAAAKVIKPSTRKQTKLTSELLPPPNDAKSRDAIATTVTTTSKHNAFDPVKPTRRISNEYEFEKTEESLYVSALEEIPSDVSRLSDTRALKYESSSDLSYAKSSSQSSNDSSPVSSQSSSEEEVFAKDKSKSPSRRLPPGVEDFDKENWNDPFQVSHYAMNIFDYLKQREHDYKIKDYMKDQPELSKWMRSLLVDWMVEVQESFELNHETLYLAVKIVDTYLGKERVSKDSLQLLGAAALLIACKYDVSYLNC
jgi:G2/mitotic-specific cyclin-B3